MSPPSLRRVFHTTNRFGQRLSTARRRLMFTHSLRLPQTRNAPYIFCLEKKLAEQLKLSSENILSNKTALHKTWSRIKIKMELLRKNGSGDGEERM